MSSKRSPGSCSVPKTILSPLVVNRHFQLCSFLGMERGFQELLALELAARLALGLELSSELESSFPSNIHSSTSVKGLLHSVSRKLEKVMHSAR